MCWKFFVNYQLTWSIDIFLEQWTHRSIKADPLNNSGKKLSGIYGKCSQVFLCNAFCIEHMEKGWEIDLEKYS